MAIKSTLAILWQNIPISVPGAYSRTGIAKINTQTGEVQVEVFDYRNKEAARKITEQKVTRMYLPYDPENLEHVAQWEAEGMPDPTTFQFGYDHDDPEWWNGSRTAEEPIQRRNIILPLELSLAVAQMAVPGEAPDKQTDNMISQLYRACMMSGKFVEPEVV